jgi:hypothetical protein
VDGRPEPERPRARSGAKRLGHHDLCFGCGLSNFFGLQLEASSDGAGELQGRFFIKQDHQGASGTAHAGVLVAGLAEAMDLCVGALGRNAMLRGIDVDLMGPFAVGTFVDVTASLTGDEDGRLEISATARAGDSARAQARGVFVERAPG